MTFILRDEQEDSLPEELEVYFDRARSNISGLYEELTGLLYLRHRLFIYRALKWGKLSKNEVRAMFGYKSDRPIKRAVEVVEALLNKKELDILSSKDDSIESDEDDV